MNGYELFFTGRRSSFNTEVIEERKLLSPVVVLHRQKFSFGASRIGQD